MKTEISYWRMGVVGALLLILPGCATRQTQVNSHESLNAALWIKSSAEYFGSTVQAYRIAASSLDHALANPRWSAALEQRGDFSGLPPAILLDLDQTVLDTYSYNARIILQYGAHSRKKFSEWCQQIAAPAIPGVKEFINYAIKKGISVFYYSARRENLRDCTTNNLRALGLPLPDQKHLLLNNGAPSASKTMQRTKLASQFRILLLVGDNLDDFLGDSKTDAATRRSLASQYADRWGREWIVLPNPMYGHWESSLYKFDHTLTRDEQLLQKLQQLR